MDERSLLTLLQKRPNEGMKELMRQYMGYCYYIVRNKLAEFPQEDIKEMLIRAVDDLIENCLMDNGLFYYKELPSLARLGNNTLLLESLAIAYELTGDKKYLAPGLETFKRAIYEKPSTINGQKREEEDAMVAMAQWTY